MHPEDYAQQIGAYYFCCLWLGSWTLLAIVGGIICVIDKIKEWKHIKK